VMREQEGSTRRSRSFENAAAGEPAQASRQTSEEVAYE
jgi:hypothetical protein